MLLDKCRKACKRFDLGRQGIEKRSGEDVHPYEARLKRVLVDIGARPSQDSTDLERKKNRGCLRFPVTSLSSPRQMTTNKTNKSEKDSFIISSTVHLLEKTLSVVIGWLTLTSPYKGLQKSDQHVFPHFALEIGIRCQRSESIILDCKPVDTTDKISNQDRKITRTSSLSILMRITWVHTFGTNARRSLVY